MTATFTWAGRAVPVNRRTMIARGVRRIMTTRDYQKFIEELAYTIKQQCPVHISGPAVVTYHQHSNHDIDALEKPLLDALEASGLIENDRLVVAVNKRRFGKKRGDPDRLEVTVRDA